MENVKRTKSEKKKKYLLMKELVFLIL